MKIAVFDTHKYEKELLTNHARMNKIDLHFFEVRLNEQTSHLCKGFDGVVCFVNDKVNKVVIENLKSFGVQVLATRSAGFNHIDTSTAKNIGLPVLRVPEYSPYAVAEFATTLLMSLNRKVHKSYLRVHELNFSLDGLTGFDLHGKTIGVVGTGKIGKVFAKIMQGFGCKVLLYDIKQDSLFASENKFEYSDLNSIYKSADVISLHVPLTPETKHLINKDAFSKMKPNVVIINTGRGALIDAKDLIWALKNKKIHGAALDVYEEEEGVFFEDHSDSGIDDDTLARLLTFPNVLITSHQAFLTEEALLNIVQTTFENLNPENFKNINFKNRIV